MELIAARTNRRPCKHRVITIAAGSVLLSLRMLSRGGYLRILDFVDEIEDARRSSYRGREKLLDRSGIISRPPFYLRPRPEPRVLPFRWQDVAAQFRARTLWPAYAAYHKIPVAINCPHKSCRVSARGLIIRRLRGVHARQCYMPEIDRRPSPSRTFLSLGAARDCAPTTLNNTRNYPCVKCNERLRATPCLDREITQRLINRNRSCIDLMEIPSAPLLSLFPSFL